MFAYYKLKRVADRLPHLLTLAIFECIKKLESCLI